jgi:hypothetical protein
MAYLYIETTTIESQLKLNHNTNFKHVAEVSFGSQINTLIETHNTLND